MDKNKEKMVGVQFPTFNQPSKLCKQLQPVLPDIM
jgi:hypothetical protein